MLVNFAGAENAFQRRNIDERNFLLFTLTIDERTMNYPTLYVTHVEVSSHHLIKIHGQVNRDRARLIETAMPTTMTVFHRFPPPLINMLQPECIVLVYYRNLYFRGKFVSSDNGETANVLLIDLGVMVNIELANVSDELSAIDCLFLFLFCLHFFSFRFEF